MFQCLLKSVRVTTKMCLMSSPINYRDCQKLHREIVTLSQWYFFPVNKLNIAVSQVLLNFWTTYTT